MDKEFEEKCLSKRTITVKPSTSKIEGEKLIQYIADQHKNNSEYFLECAKNILNTTTPLAAVLIAHFAMEHKANQLLAFHGYKVGSHKCTQIALSRIVGEKDLAKMLSDIFTLRQSVGYRMTLKQSEESREQAKKIISEIVIPFFDKINNLLAEIK